MKSALKTMESVESLSYLWSTAVSALSSCGGTMILWVAFCQKFYRLENAAFLSSSSYHCRFPSRVSMSTEILTRLILLVPWWTSPGSIVSRFITNLSIIFEYVSLASCFKYFLWIWRRQMCFKILNKSVRLCHCH